MANNNVTILDCTLRDGGYLNNWQFDKKLARETYMALSKSGVDFVEIGFRGSEKYFDKKKFGLWRFSREEDIKEVTANIAGAKLAIMADYGKVELEDFCEARKSAVKLVRVAANKDKIKNAINLLEKIKTKGYKVSLNAMGYANYSQSEKDSLIETLKKVSIDYIYVADSYGSLFFDDIKPLLGPLLEIPNIKVGFHPHNNLQMSFANTLEAIRCGVHIIDSTIYGMGRAAGNLPTEIILAYLERESPNRYNSIPVLSIIDKYFVSLQKQETWGYHLPYMLAGMFQCHPYYAKTLIDQKEYTIEDIWKTLEYIKDKKPIGFSKELMDSVINEGIIGNLNKVQQKKEIAKKDTTNKLINHKKIKIPYVNRHSERDFLILANGPSLTNYKSDIDKFIKKYDPIIMAGNYIAGLFVPHYHAFNNKRRFTSYIDSVSEKSTLLLGQNMLEKYIKEYTKREYETLFFENILCSDFEIIDGVIQTNCRTIAVLLLGVAIVMGARRVFAVGMDGYMGKKKENIHFYSEKDEKENQEMIIEMHHWNQRFLEQINEYLLSNKKEGIHILTPTSHKTFFKGIDNYI